jgi:hypothetical protein
MFKRIWTRVKTTLFKPNRNSENAQTYLLACKDVMVTVANVVAHHDKLLTQ